MSITTAAKVADYILCWANEKGKTVSNLELQKFVYYVQAWYLAVYDEPLFDDRLEAWVHGPVQPELWRKYKDCSWHPIDVVPKCPKYTEEIEGHINRVMEVYSKYNGFDLENIVHHEDPWMNARKGLAPDEPSNAVITHESMKEFYGAEEE